MEYSEEDVFALAKAIFENDPFQSRQFEFERLDAVWQEPLLAHARGVLADAAPLFERIAGRNAHAVGPASIATTDVIAALDSPPETEETL